MLIRIEISEHQLERMIMSTLLLTNAITNLSADVQALVAKGANTVPQSDVDAATAAVVALDAVVQSALTPAAVVATPAAPAAAAVDENTGEAAPAAPVAATTAASEFIGHVVNAH